MTFSSGGLTGGSASAAAGGAGGIGGSYTRGFLGKLVKQAKEWAKDQMIRGWGLARSLARDYVQRGIGGLIRGLIGRVFSFFGVANVVQALLSGINFIDNFDWNISDKEISQQRQQAIIQGAGVMGGALGQTVGWVLCGQVGQAAVMKIDPAMASAIRNDVSEEAYEEVVNVWKTTAAQVFDLANEQAFYFAYSNVRRAIKNNGLAKKLIGEERLKAWGDEESKPFSFAQWRQDKIEKIPNPAVKEFVEEFGEELWDSCQEAFLVVASSIDSQMALQRSQIREQVSGSPVVVDIQPNREERQVIRIYATETTVRQEVSSALAQHQIISGYDLGEMIEGGVPNYASKNPHTISAIIKWCNRQGGPPYRGKKDPFIRRRLTIPRLKRTGWTWQQVQKLAGGLQGVMTGRYKCWVKFDDNAQTFFSANSHVTAEEIVEGLATLSEAKIVRKSLVKTEKTSNHNEGNNNFPDEVRVWPWEMEILRSGYTRAGKVRSSDDKKNSRISRKFPLYFKLNNEQLDDRIRSFLNDAYNDVPII